jgi:hypothetical protein
MKKRLSPPQALLVLAIVAAISLIQWVAVDTPTLEPQASIGKTSGPAADSGFSDIDRLFEEKKSDRLVTGEGIVRRLLPDDNDGSRHQRFILELPSGLTLLVAHNIDVAPRAEDLKRGDTITFQGEYEWNERGGVLHWTHHDPSGDHPGGWLELEGRRYE